MPLPRSLASGHGRRKAAVLLAATKGKQLKLRFLPSRRGYSRTSSARAEDTKKDASVESLRDPFSEYSTDSTVKLPQISN